MEKDTPASNPGAANEARQNRAEKGRSVGRPEHPLPERDERPAHHPTPGSAEGERNPAEQST